VLGTLWNAFGGYDYIMTRTRNLDYLGQMGNAQEILAWVDRFPMWAQVAYGLGVWGSVAGSLLMLARSRHAASAFMVSLVAAVVSFASQMTSAIPPSLDTTVNKVMPVVIVAVIAALWWYCRRSQARGILR
jgi:hypothetical protein